MENKRNEIQISMSSKLKELMKLANEYDSLGGEATFVGILHFDDEGEALSSLNGTYQNLTSLIGSNEDVMEISAAAHMINKLTEMEDE